MGASIAHVRLFELILGLGSPRSGSLSAKCDDSLYRWGSRRAAIAIRCRLLTGLLALALCFTPLHAASWDLEVQLGADAMPDAPESGRSARALARVGFRDEVFGAAARVELKAVRTDTPWRSGGRAELGEAHLTWADNWGSLRLGRQQVAWGRADAFRLLDQVNPWRFPDAFFDDLADARVPVWMVNLERPIGAWDLQILTGWLDGIDDADRGYLHPGPLGVTGSELSQAEPFIGLRLGSQVGDLAFSLHVLNQQNLQPLWWTPSGGGGLQLYERSRTLLGVGADLPLGPAVVRAEAARSFSKTLDATSQARDQRTDQLLIGVDFQFGNWLVSPQLYTESRHLPDYGLGDSDRSYASLLVRLRALQDQLEVRTFATSDLRGDESWLSLRVAYTLNDNVELRFHADAFDSKPGGLFGPFADMSRVGVETVLRY